MLRAMRRVLSYVLAALFALGAQAGGPPPVTLEAKGCQPLAGHLELLEGRPAATLAEALQAASEGRFQPLAGNVSKGYTAQSVWVRFTLQVPNDAGESWLEVTPGFLQEITFYSPNGAGGYETAAAGAQLPFSERQVAHQHVVFRLGGRDHPLPGPTATCYLRVRTSSAMQVVPILWTPLAFGDAISREAPFFGAFFGIAFIIMLANLLYWLKLRELIQIQYSAYLAAMFIMFAGLEGYLALYLFPHSPIASTLLIPLAISCQPGLGVAIFSTLTDFGTVHPRLDRMYRTLAYSVSGLALLAALAGQYYTIAPALQGAILLIILLNLGLALRMSFRQHRAAGLYLLAFGPYMLGAIFRGTWILGWGPSGFLGEHAVHLGAIAHFCLMNLPLADRLGHIKRERDQAIQGAREAAEEHHQELEGRVEVRTTELREEQAQTAEALVQEQQVVLEQRRFLAMVSHEFRTPLAIIDGSAQMARVAVEPPPPALTHATGRIQRCASDLLHLLDAWLTQDRIASGLRALQPRLVALKEWLTDLVSHAQGAEPGRVVSLHLATLPDTLVCDPGLLGTAIQNLLSNAVKYSPEGSPISVSGAVQDGWLRLEVTDRGRGIPTDQLALITTRYFRGRNAGHVPGLGLGLHLVSTIATLHGGRLDLESVEGQGTTARLLLPCGTSIHAQA